MIKLRNYVILIFIVASCTSKQNTATNLPVGNQLTHAKTADGQYISWKEHIIDDTEISGIAISGSDGLSIADLDKDGFIDIVSVHESDTEYDEALEGYIRIAFGSKDPNKWELATLAKGAEAAAAEDVAIEDLNGDGFLDIVVACELAHLIYFQNPGTNIRSTKWKRNIPTITKNRGSYIRVFTADFNKDGSPEIIAANKGGQLGSGSQDSLVNKSDPISYFELTGNPLDDQSWKEHELISVKIPINSQPIDIDNDGDLDVIAGSRGENKIILFENVSNNAVAFKQHPINLNTSLLTLNNTLPQANGFNMEYMDVNGDNRLDIILAVTFDDFALGTHLVWLEQPADWSQEWILHPIGDIVPDKIVGLSVADINNDGNKDVIVGSYSRGDRKMDEKITTTDALGRLAWFENIGNTNKPWIRHDISRRKRGMFDKFISLDVDKDGDIDFLSTRGNSEPYDGVFWLEQVRTKEPIKSFSKARKNDSEEMPLASE